MCMISLLAVGACGKHPLTKDTASATPDATKLGATNITKPPVEPKPDASKTLVGAVTLGGNSSSGLINKSKVMSANIDDIFKNLNAADKEHFKGDLSDQALIRFNSTYDAKNKKLASAKNTNSLLPFNGKVDGLKTESVKPADITKSLPDIKVNDVAVTMSWDDKQKLYISQEDVSAPIADLTKSPVLKIAKNDALKIAADVSVNLPPVVTLKSSDQVMTQITLDATKEKLGLPDIAIDSWYHGAEGDPQAPECYIYSATGIGEAKPITINNLIKIADQDSKLSTDDIGDDAMKAMKETLQKMPAGTMDAQIICNVMKSDQSPEVVASTVTTGLKITIVPGAPAAPAVVNTAMAK